MDSLSKRVLVLHGDPVLGECLTRAGQLGSLEVVSVASWDELLEIGRAEPPSTVAIVDPFDHDFGDEKLSPDLAALLNRLPSLPVVAAMYLHADAMEHARRLGSWGVVQVLDLYEERTPVAVLTRLQMATGRPLQLLLEQSLPKRLSGISRAIVAGAARTVAEGGKGEDLARSFHITSRTLSRWCRRAALPPPRRLLGWMRVLLAAELLDDSGRTVQNVAYACGYSSDTTLRQALRGFVGVTPTDLRQNGAFASTAKAFAEDLRAARSPAHRFRTGAPPSGWNPDPRD
jgi:AraC-like DNA-binding protein